MSTAADQLRTELAKLNEPDRAALARFLIESLHGQNDVDADLAWNSELEARGQQITTGQATGEPAEKVFSELRDKYA